MAHETCAEVSGLRLAQIFTVRRPPIPEGQLPRPGQGFFFIGEALGKLPGYLLGNIALALVCRRVLMPLWKEPKSGRW